MRILSSIKTPEDLRKYNINELKLLAQDLRDEIINTVSKTGGHLAPNLGVVELTLALHTSFNSGIDKIIWDVGHQAYSHKLLTGRLTDFNTLRQYNGISGYPKRKESIHDVFDVGHSSTSLSAALGFAIQRDLHQEDHEVVAVIGDGALTGGMAYEALNHIGHLGKKMIIVLNDNEMSIEPNVGALSTYLSSIRTAPKYEKTKQDIETLLRKIPAVGKPVARSLEKIKDSLKYLLITGVVFEELGFTYIGPIDGHNVDVMQKVFEQAKKALSPVLIHCKTIKGLGYGPAEDQPDRYHGVSPFDIQTGTSKRKKPHPTYTEVFGDTLAKLANKDNNLVAISAAMKDSVGLTKFARANPKRFYDVGIAEQHAVTLAAGLAAAGMRPIVAVYSTFLQRAYDQVLHDVCLQNLPVVFAIDRAGLVGHDGETHHGVFDISFLRSIPNMTIMAPKDESELVHMLATAISLERPVALRYPRGCGEGVDLPIEPEILEIGKAETLKQGNDVSIWALGNMVPIALKVAEILNVDGIEAEVINSRFVKPFDNKRLQSSFSCKLIVSLEDHVVQGGLASVISEVITEHEEGPIHLKLGVPDQFVTHGSLDELFDSLGLTADKIVERILTKLREV